MEKLKSFQNLFSGIIFISLSILLPAELSLDVNLIKTGQYNVSDFLDPSVSLWSVNINCIDCIENDSISYVIEVRLNFNEINPAIWGVTEVRYMSSQNTNDILSNFDFQSGEGLLQDYVENDEFISLLEENYYLPAGNVSLFVTAYLYDENLDIDNIPVSGTWLASDEEVGVQNNVVSELVLLSPANNSDVSDPYPWLRWESPGFTGDGSVENSVEIEYTLYVYLFDPRFHSNYLDAIEDDNYLYFKEVIYQHETGIPKQVQIQYPSDDRDLACGYQYVWFIEGRDIIQDHPFNGDSGIWGWPEPIQSPLFVFNYGSVIRSDNIVSPSIGSEISTVLPIFYVDPINCAETYEIWLSNKDDSDVENPIWTSGSLQSNVNTYTSDATGLMPGSDYKWKIRVNPDGEPGPWSDIFNFTVMNYTLDNPATGQVINTIFPTFYFSGPSDIGGFELRISNNEDPTLEYGNIYSDYVPSFPYELPADIPIGLLPGNIYYWKLIFLDGNENITGEIDDYTIIESFSISDIELISPSDGASDLSLTPSFMWDGPIGVSQYELSITESGDPMVENPLFTTNVSGTFYQFPQYGDYSLEYGQLYHWKVVPLDMNGNQGLSSENYSFSTAIDITETVADETDYIKPEFSLSGGPPNSPKDIIVTLLEGVSGTEEYIILFSDNQNMSSLFAEITLEAGQTETVLNGADIDWGLTVYVQVFAMADGENIGEESTIQIISLPEKPGSDEQVGISITLEESSTQLTVEITNLVTNASDYILEIAYDAEMTEIFYSGPAFDNMPTVYPESAEPLMFGEMYFIQVYAIDDDGLHGIPSSIISIFIPNVISPVIIDEYSWEATQPASSSYVIHFSTTDDFSSIIIEEFINGTSFSSLPAGILDPGTAYYWKVQGLDANNNLFGDASSINYFITDPIATPILNPISEETSLLPEFTWNAIDQVQAYLIDVASDASMETIIWSFIITSANTIYDESALLLEFASTYYWRISTLSDEVSILSISSIESFSTTSIFPVNGLSPDGATETFTPTMEWELNNNYSSYKIMIAEDSEFSSIILNSIVGTNHIILNDGLLQPGTTYYWKVEGLDSNGENTAGPSQVALLVMPSLTEIPLIAPGKDEQISNLTPKLKWGSLQNTSSYQLKIATDSELASVIIDEIVSGTEYQIPEDRALLNSMTYYWQIVVSTETIIIKSEIGKFSTPSSIEINILSLDDGADISITNPIFSWEGIEGVSAYNIQFSTNSDFSESWTKQSGSSNFEYSPEPLLEFNTLYYWRVCALNNAGERISTWTTPRSFTLSNTFIVYLEAPPSGEVVTTKKPVFSWSPIEGVSKYEIRISSNEDYSQIMWHSSNVMQNSVQYPSSGAEALLIETVYYWSVRAISENIALGEYCESNTFTISEVNQPVLTGPINGTSESILPFFTWNKIPKANVYGLVLGINEDLSQIIFENHNISDKQFQYATDAPPLKYDTAYYWKIIAYDENGIPLGDFSVIAMFTTPAGIIQIEFIYDEK